MLNWLFSSPEKDGPEEARHLTDLALEYGYEDLSRATGGFAEANRLGAGAAGAVFRGTLRGGTEVAVKVLKDDGDLFGFEDEVRVLSRFRHPNLVTLLGWGSHGQDKYLIYELLDGGDVGKRLTRSKNGRAAFTWQERLRVAMDASCGLSHMMNSHPKAFHRDIKPANILLDANGTAKMADFGLAGFLPSDGERLHLSVVEISGTPGYACPHYISTGRVTEQTEVYSFGVVLLELLLNQPPALAGPQGDIIFPLLQTVQPAAPGAHGRLIAALDRTAGAWPQPVVDRFAEVALACLDLAPERRPLFEALVGVFRQLSAQLRRSAEGDPFAFAQQPRLPVGAAGAPPPPPLMQHQRSSGSKEAAHGGGIGLSSPAYGAEAARGVAARGYPSDDTPGDAAPPPPEPPRIAHGAGPRAGGMPAGGGARAPPAEVVLECSKTEGVDISALDPSRRALAFAITATGWRATIGRQHQPEFFERMVPSRDRLSCISRAHFELSWEASNATLSLRKLTGNGLLVDDRPMSSNEVFGLVDGTRVGFIGLSDKKTQFLVLIVRLRSSASVASEGPHPAIETMEYLARRRSQLRAAEARTPAATRGPEDGSSASPGASSVPPALLECIRAAGSVDAEGLPADLRAVALPGDGIPLEVGRQHQLGFFERLLQDEPQWLAYISRTHCRLRLERGTGASPQWQLKVENLSSNVVLVCRRPLAKGQGEVALTEGGTLGFVAVRVPGEEPTLFLEFRLRFSVNARRL